MQAKEILMFSLNDGGLLKYLCEKYMNITVVDDLLSYPIWLMLTAIIGVCLVGYLLGSINSAVLISTTLYKDDIRKHGSGNAGLTNVLRTYGKKAALLTLVGDMLKAVLSIGLAGLFFGFQYFGGISLSQICYVAGLCAVLGHIFPVYYGFRGGKGVLTTATMALVLAPIPFAILFVLFVIIVLASRYVSLGSVCVAVLYPVLVNGYLSFLALPHPGLISLTTVFIAIMVVWCHRENLKRISDRTERKLSFKKKDVEVKTRPEEDDDE